MKAIRRLALRDLRFNKTRAVFATILISLPVMAVLILGSLVTLSSNHWMFYGTEGIDDMQAVGSVACNCEVRQTPDVAVLHQPGRVDGDVDAAVLMADILSPNNTVEFTESPIYIELQRTPGHNSLHGEAQRASVNEGLLIEGRLPEDNTEIVISTITRDQLGVDVGDTIMRRSPEGETNDVLITGLTDRTDLVYSGSASAPTLNDLVNSSYGMSQFTITGPDPVTWEQVKQFNEYGIQIASTAVLADPPSAEEVQEWLGEEMVVMGGGSANTILIGTIIILAVLEVVLLISPPFTMAVKRNERALGQLAALGATKRHLRSLMLYQGLFLGLAGALLGIAGFFLLRLLLGVLTGESILIILWHYPVAVVVAVALGLIAALLPAITAARIDVVAVLTGREAGRGIRGRRHIAGPVILAIGMIMLLTVREGSEIVLAAGLITSVLGLIFTAPLFVSMASAVIGRISLAGKLAGRDSVRNVQRTAPGVAAMVVVTVIATFAVSQLNTMMSKEFSEENVVGLRGSVWVELSVYGAGGDDEAQLEEGIAWVDSIRPVKSWTPIYEAGGGQVYAETVVPVENRCPVEEPGWGEGLSEAEYEEAWAALEKDDERCSVFRGDDRSWSPAIPYFLQAGTGLVDDGTIYKLLASPEDVERGSQILRDGGMIVDHPRMISNGEGTVNAVQYDPWADEVQEEPILLSTVSAPAHVLDRSPAPTLILSFQAAEELGLEIVPRAALIEFEDPVTVLESGNFWRDFTEHRGLLLTTINEVDTSYVWLALVMAIITLLVAVGTAIIIVILSGRETRGDFDTIDAIGGKPGLRRRVSIAMAAVLTTAGVVPGLIIGLILTTFLGDLIGEGGLTAPILPLIGLGAIIIAISCLAGALFAPRRKTLTRRVD